MKIVVKSLLSLLIFLVFALVLAACDWEKEPTETTKPIETTQPKETTQPTTSDETPEPDEEEEFQYAPRDLGGETIVIMCQIVEECDPRRDDYRGARDQEEARARLEAIEQKHNVKIEFKSFPTSADWGPNRVNYIINGYTAGEPHAHLYEIHSYWVMDLASTGAIAPLKGLLRDLAHPLYDHSFNQFGRFGDDFYLLQSGYQLNNQAGIYYNYDLWQSLGLGKTPAEMYLDDEWNFDAFETVVREALTKMPDEHYVIGGNWAQWAEHFVHANGGYNISPFEDRVSFTEAKAVEAIQFLNNLAMIGAWEPSPGIDQGLEPWKNGKVLFHYGEFWFLSSDIRWNTPEYNFRMGFAPWPKGYVSSDDEYHAAKFGETMWAIAGGYEQGNITTEDIFVIWMELQEWKEKDDVILDYEIAAEKYMGEDASVDAFVKALEIPVVYDRLFAIGISGWAEDEWYIQAARAVRDGDVLQKLESMFQKYQAALDQWKQ